MTVIGHLDLALALIAGLVFAFLGFSFWVEWEPAPVFLSFGFIGLVLIALPILAWTGVLA